MLLATTLAAVSPWVVGVVSTVGGSLFGCLATFCLWGKFTALVTATVSTAIPIIVCIVYGAIGVIGGLIGFKFVGKR